MKIHQVLGLGLRATRDLFRPKILLHALWPPLLALGIWIAIAFSSWTTIVAWIVSVISGQDWLGTSVSWIAAIPLGEQWLGSLGGWVGSLGQGFVHIAVFFIFAPLVYFTTLLLIVAFALPSMMAHIAEREYGNIASRSAGVSVLVGSLANTTWAGCIFILGWLFTFPLLFVPGGIFVLPIFWVAWLSQRTFRYDVLVSYAASAERKQVIKRERGSLYLSGILGALLGYVPILNFVSLPWTAILFVHICLSALREQRHEIDAVSLHRNG